MWSYGTWKQLLFCRCCCCSFRFVLFFGRDFTWLPWRLMDLSWISKTQYIACYGVPVSFSGILAPYEKVMICNAFIPTVSHLYGGRRHIVALQHAIWKKHDRPSLQCSSIMASFPIMLQYHSVTLLRRFNMIGESGDRSWFRLERSSVMVCRTLVDYNAAV